MTTIPFKLAKQLMYKRHFYEQTVLLTVALLSCSKVMNISPLWWIKAYLNGTRWLLIWKKLQCFGHLTLPSYSQCGRFEFRTGTGREKIAKTYSFFQSKIFLSSHYQFFFRLRFQFQNSWFVLTRHSLLQGSFYIFGWRPSKSRLKFCWAFSFGTK